MRSLEVTIPGEPVAQGRPRSAVINGFVRIYSPKRSAIWRKTAATIFSTRCHQPFVGPISIKVISYFKTPKAKKKLAGTVKTSRPDVDNCLKAVMDAGNSTLWLDDSQVVSAEIHKLYCPEHVQPMVRIAVTELP